MNERQLPSGYRCAGIACGIKDGETPDLALFVSDVPACAAGVFTRNRVCGAPVRVSRSRVPSDTVCGVVINSGNANACTGERGLADARRMTVEVARQIDCDALDVLVCSTGVIGRCLPMDKLMSGIPTAAEKLDATPDAFEDAARAMMTTDTVHKQSVRETRIDGRTIRVSGAGKGAAMIGPDMATMLAVVMTDAALTPDQTDAALRGAADRSFHCISVEGHTSTSDSVILLANGAAETGSLREDGAEQVSQMVNEVCLELAQAIIRDAEGADHFLAVRVSGARSPDDARRIAKTVADDTLVKTAIAGTDPNWGRIVSACGRTGVELTESDIALRINGALIYQRGNPVDFDHAAASNHMRDNRDVDIEIELPFGEAGATFWTSDLTKEYVRLNSDYTT